MAGSIDSVVSSAVSSVVLVSVSGAEVAAGVSLSVSAVSSPPNAVNKRLNNKIWVMSFYLISSPFFVKSEHISAYWSLI
jgi:hypothetical protein